MGQAGHEDEGGHGVTAASGPRVVCGTGNSFSALSCFVADESVHGDKLIGTSEKQRPGEHLPDVGRE